MALSIPQMARMSQLLDEALALDEAGRRSWLEGATQEHPDLAAALREALRPGAAQAADLRVLMSLPKLDATDGASAPGASGLKPGARVGPYELIRPLGAGGMAEVWLARRADGAFKREVALKLPMLARLQAGLEARFARERDILASLEHPHITRLYDAGVDPQGLPYLAMECVQGAPLTDWCDTHRLGIPERLGLFLQVLEAVQYAHEKKVIHRDLKPSNILVTDAGQVRLLDFGVARLLEGEETDQPALTSVYGRALTPDYASPELLRGDPIDARSDLYSLGVLLYELLTGTRPYRLKSAASIGLLDQAIATLEVKKPSLQLEQAAAATGASTVERLARQLRGDLDAIVLMALAKDPAQRYPSAAAMAEDLRRYLAGKPIQAQPARLFYRLRKFVLRNATLLGVSAAALAAILATVGYALYRESRAQVTVSAKALAVPVAPSPASAGAAFAPPAHSIAVLPFVNMSSDREREYFSDGLTEEMIDLLSQVPDLRVPARTSSFYFKGKSERLATIAHELGVAYVLEGSVREAGKRLRITAQLIRADTGYNLWSQSYDRDDTDVFAVQDDIAKAVVGALKLKLGTGAQVIGARGTANIEAFDQYLLGRQFERLHSLEGYRHAVEAYRKAITLDPNYAAAFGGLAVAEARVADNTGDPLGIERAGRDVEKALVLAPNDSNGYVARARLRSGFLWDWSGAQADIEKSLTLDPRNGDAQIGFARLLAALGRLPEAIAAQKKATELDPLSSNAWRYLGFLYTETGDYTAADAALGRAIEIEPTMVFAFTYLGTLRLLESKDQEALEAFRKIDIEGLRLPGIAMTEHTLGHARESRQALEELLARHSQEAGYQIAQVFAWRGEHDQAFDWLERAYRQHDGGLADIKGDPLLKSLRADPRFRALLRKMRLPE